MMMENFEFDKETATITNYKGNDRELIIPSKIDGVEVSKIGDIVS